MKPKTKPTPLNEQPFFTDVTVLRARARQHIEAGAVTAGYGGDPVTSVKILNASLATELVCVLRYKRHYFMATGPHSTAAAAEFLEHAAEEQGHADRIAARIVQLGGAPDFSPEGLLTRSHSEYVEGTTLAEMLTEDLVAERVAIDSYREIADYFAEFDQTTRQMIEDIQSVEEEHAEDLSELLRNLPKES